jgi:3-hydroxybutyryl-CoA dehydrogenase
MNVEDIKKITIIGSGTMGAGISQCFAQAGFRVGLYDPNQKQIDKALIRIKNSQAALIKENLISEVQAKRSRESIQPSTDMTQILKDAQFVLEAAPEVLELKQTLLLEIERHSAKDTIIVSNTSGLSIADISRKCQRPELIAGMHWVNPPEIVPLVEVIKGRMTSDTTVDFTYQLAEKAGKMPVVIKKEAAGFGLNRLQFAVFREALHLVENGVVSPADVDRIMKFGLGFRYPWLGPLETADLGGLDVFYNIADYLFKELSSEERPFGALRQLVKSGNYGIKSGKGFYNYSQNPDEVLRKRDFCFISQLKLMKSMDRRPGPV